MLQQLVERADVAPDGIEVRLRSGGIHSLVAELMAEASERPTEDQETTVFEGIAACRAVAGFGRPFYDYQSGGA